MLEGIAFLVVVYGLTILIPAIGQFRKMREINKNCKSVVGRVIKTDSTQNMMAGPLAGTAYRTTIQYQPFEDREPYEIFLRDHNLLMRKTYSQGDTVEVIYDADAPYRSYPKPDWQNTQKGIYSRP